MPMMKSGLILLLLVAPAAAFGSQAQAKGGLDDVITILLRMVSEFNTMMAQDRSNWSAYSQWSDGEETDKNTYVTNQKAIVLSKEAQKNANIQQKTQLIKDIGDLQQSGRDTTTSLNELVSLRQQEHAQHNAEVGDLTKTIESVNKAVEILEGHYAASGSTLAEIKQRVQYALSLASQTVKPGVLSLTPSAAAFIQNPDFLSTDGNKYASYKGQGGAAGVITTLQDLRSALEQQKQASIEKESDNRATFENTKGLKEAELGRIKTELGDKNSRKSTCEATITGCGAAIDTANGNIGDAQSYLTTLLADRTKFSDEFDARVRTRNDEQAATQAALDALQAVSGSAKDAVGLLQKRKKGRSFLQILNHNNGKVPCPKCIDEEKRLVVLGEKFRSGALIQAATGLRAAGMASAAAQRAMYNPEAMEPVKGLLTDLITRLESEAAEEAGHNEWCETEKNSGTTGMAQREQLIQGYQSNIEAGTTAVAQLKGEITFMESEIARVEGESREAETIRTNEHNAFVQAKADHDEVITKLSEAISALSGVQFSLVQQKKTPVPRRHRLMAALMDTTVKAKVENKVVKRASPFGDYGSQGGSSSSALDMLNDLEERYTAARTQLVNDEASAKSTYDALMAKNAQFVTDTTNTKNAKLGERRGKLQKLQQQKDDMKTNMVELKEISQYLQDLRPSCDDIRSTFEERKRRREAEISALKECLAVLSDPSSMR